MLLTGAAPPDQVFRDNPEVDYIAGPIPTSRLFPVNQIMDWVSRAHALAANGELNHGFFAS